MLSRGYCQPFQSRYVVDFNVCLREGNWGVRALLMRWLPKEGLLEVLESGTHEVLLQSEGRWGCGF